MRSVDVTVVGGGPGGYVCAIRAGQLGLSTIVVERYRMGGECLQMGCIPSKSLISVARLYDKARHGSKFGIKASSLEIDYHALQQWRSGVISTLEAGIGSLCKGYGVEIVKGDAELVDRNRLVVSTAGGTEEITTKNLVVATGTRPIELPGISFDGKLVMSSKEALELTEAPARLLIIGGGAIGMEFASMYQKFGSQITIVELTEQLLPGTDSDLVGVVQRNLERNGARILLKSRVLSVEKKENAITAAVQTPEGTVDIEAEKLLLSVGKRPNTEKMNLDRIGVRTSEKGYIITDEHMRTSVNGIYAIGDVRGPPLLAHKASKEGIVAAESITGLPTAADWKAMPDAVFTDPEIATVGLTETKAVESGYPIKKSRFPFSALGRALSAGETEGFVRVISDTRNGQVLGAQIVGPEASNLISEVALAMEMGATVEDLALTIHPHPTLPEAIMEAAEVAAGRPIHQLRS